MFGLTRPAYPAALVTAAALALAACGDNSGTQSVSSTGTTAETSDTGTGATGTTELETTSDETSSTSTTGGPEPTTEAPSTTSSSSDGSSSTTAADECANGLLDGDETDVDCGGDSCPTCDVGQACEIFSDCGTQACVGKLCIVPDCLEDSDCDVLDDPTNEGVLAGARDNVVRQCREYPVYGG